jgi:hypothetical protein
MSYCAFENTQLALEQLYNMVSEAIDSNERLKFTSRDEEYAFENIQYTMRELMHTMERYADMVETLEEKENV